MKVVAITGKRKAELVEKPDPKPKREFALVKINVTPMCTEYKWFKEGNIIDSFGHEAAGEVVEIGQPGKVKVGDRVIVMPQYPCGKCSLCLTGDYIHCEHVLDLKEITDTGSGTATYAQYVLKQDWLLIPIPDGMSYEHASMACCGLGPTFGAMQLMKVDASDTVLIAGMGPVGLGGVINGVYRGARVIGIEPHPYRMKLAKELGAEVVIDPNNPDALRQIMDLTEGIGADKAIDCAGVVSVQKLLIDATRRKGHIAFVAQAGELPIRITQDIVAKGLTLYGAWHWNLIDTPRMMEVISGSSALLDRLITHTFPMSKVQEAFELQITGNCGKVILYPWK